MTTDAGAEAPPGRLRESAQVSWPLIVGSLSTLALAFADTVIVGRYGTADLAAVALVLPVYVLASALLLPFGSAVQVLVARWTGAGDTARVGRLIVVGGLACAALGGAVALVVVVAAGPIVAALSGDAAPQDATTVLRILALSLPLVGLSAHLRGVFGGLTQTKVAMQLAVIVAGINIPLDLLFVFGADLGAIGSALATVLSTAIGAGYVLMLARRRLAPSYPMAGGGGRSDRERLLRPLWRIGWPDASFGAIAYGADVVLVGIVALIGTAALAGHRAIAVTIMLLWTVVFSCSTGIAILAGQRLGADDLDGVAAYRRSGALLMALAATPLVLPPVIAPRWFFGLFTDDVTVIAEAVPAARLLPLVLLGMLVAMPLTGVLRAGGDTRGIMWIGTGSQIGVAIPLAYLAVTRFELGLAGIVLALAGSWAMRTVLTVLRYRQGRWQRLLDDG
ncbi:MAG: MATE family efflux transporter [Nitriliruptoraceae bacterium]|nr:MATE family efflux transporter [Nitriliruptoraceae bacterium]